MFSENRGLAGECSNLVIRGGDAIGIIRRRCHRHLYELASEACSKRKR